MKKNKKEKDKKIIVVSPKWLELLAQKMRNACVHQVEISESAWVNEIKEKISASEQNDGIEAEFCDEEIRLVYKRIKIS